MKTLIAIRNFVQIVLILIVQLLMPYVYAILFGIILFVGMLLWAVVYRVLS